MEWLLTMPWMSDLVRTPTRNLATLVGCALSTCSRTFSSKHTSHHFIYIFVLHRSCRVPHLASYSLVALPRSVPLEKSFLDCPFYTAWMTAECLLANPILIVHGYAYGSYLAEESGMIQES